MQPLPALSPSLFLSPIRGHIQIAARRSPPEGGGQKLAELKIINLRPPTFPVLMNNHESRPSIQIHS